MSCSNKTAG